MNDPLKVLYIPLECVNEPSLLEECLVEVDEYDLAVCENGDYEGIVKIQKTFDAFRILRAKVGLDQLKLFLSAECVVRQVSSFVLESHTENWPPVAHQSHFLNVLDLGQLSVFDPSVQCSISSCNKELEAVSDPYWRGVLRSLINTLDQQAVQVTDIVQGPIYPAEELQSVSLRHIARKLSNFNFQTELPNTHEKYDIFARMVRQFSASFSSDSPSSVALFLCVLYVMFRTSSYFKSCPPSLALLYLTRAVECIVSIALLANERADFDRGRLYSSSTNKILSGAGAILQQAESDNLLPTEIRGNIKRITEGRNRSYLGHGFARLNELDSALQDDIDVLFENLPLHAYHDHILNLMDVHKSLKMLPVIDQQLNSAIDRLCI